MNHAPIPDDLLRLLAEDAFDVLNWARRMGLHKSKQVDETVKAFRKRLSESYPDPRTPGGDGGRPGTPSSDAPAAQNDGGAHSVVGQGGRKAEASYAESEQQSAARSWVGNEPGVGGAASATIVEGAALWN